jgi:regulator of sigma E protease
MSMVIFILVLSALVIVHELGHYLAARFLGVKVERFAVGFGKKLFSRKKGDTEFMVCAIPLGGYVKMAGDERNACKGAPDEFFSHSIWHRAIIVVMGPITNFVFAFLCFYAIFVSGFPMITPTIGQVMDGYPAVAADLRPGDRVLSVDGRAISGWEDVVEYVRESKGESLHFVLSRAGQKIEKTIVPQQKGIKNIFGRSENLRLVGIQPQEDFIMVKAGPIASAGKAFDQVKKVTVVTLKGLYYVATGAMPAKDALSGPIGIFDLIKDAAKMGLAYLVLIMAVISTSLAIFNLFPVPVLDGGHLFFLAIEAVRRKPLPVKIEEGFTRVGFSLLICLMIFIFYNDMVRVGWIDKIAQFLKQARP